MGYQKRFISPICPHHRLMMRVTSKQPPLRWFRCPQDGCGHTAKVPITDFIAEVRVVRSVSGKMFVKEGVE